MTSKNPMNCSCCDHKKNNTDPNLHCYMFKEEPTNICHQHTAFKQLGSLIEKDVNDEISKPSLAKVMGLRQ